MEFINNKLDTLYLNYPGNCAWTAVFEPYNGQWLMTYVSYNWGGYNVVEEG